MKPEYFPTRLTEHRTLPKIGEPHPSSWTRPFQLGWVFAALTARLLLLAVLRRATGEACGREVRTVLERLGGLWIKIGQLLSMRRDIFSSAFCDGLSTLQDVAVGAPFSFVRTTVETELGRPISDIFSEFSEVPFAAASIGQLHMATLRTTNARVAVKVQKAFVADTMRRDLRAVRAICSTLQLLHIWSFFNWADFYYELDRTMAEELDYRYEAHFMKLMRKSLKPHRILVPRPYRDICREKILVMEYVNGGLLADYVRLKRTDPARVAAWEVENNVEPKKVAKRLLVSLTRQIFEDNLFHGDLHPGNIVLLRDSKVALLDFGSVGRLDTSFHEMFYRYGEAVAKGEFGKSADLFFLMSPSLPPGDLERPRKELIRNQREWALLNDTPGLPIEERRPSKIFAKNSQLMRQYNVPVAWEMLRVNRAQVSLEGSSRALHPDHRHLLLSPKFFKSAGARRLKPFDLQTTLRRNATAAASVTRFLTDGAEASSLNLAWMRRRARSLSSAQRKASALVLVFVDFLCLAGIGATAGLGLLWLHAHGLYRAPEEISRPFETLVRLSPVGWFFLGATSIAIMIRLLLARADLRRPSGEVGGQSL